MNIYTQTCTLAQNSLQLGRSWQIKQMPIWRWTQPQKLWTKPLKTMTSKRQRGPNYKALQYGIALSKDKHGFTPW